MAWRIRAVAAALIASAAASAQPLVPWRGQTLANPLNSTGAVAVGSSAAGASRVVSASPQGNGLFVYGTDGGLAFLTATGSVKGVAVLEDAPFVTAPKHVVITTGYVSGELFVYELTPGGSLTNVRARTFSTNVGPGMLATTVARDGGLQALWECGGPTLSRVLLFDDGAGKVDYLSDAPLTLPGAPVALAADDVSRRLFAVVPYQGIWSVGLDDTAPVPELVEPLDGGALGSQPAGLVTWRTSSAKLYALVALPAVSAFQVYEVGAHTMTPVTRFQVGFPDGGPRVFNAEHLALSLAPLEGFPSGALVVQDKYGVPGANYKLVDLDDLVAFTSPPFPRGGADAGAVADAGSGTHDAGTSSDAGHGTVDTTPGNGTVGQESGEVPSTRVCGCGLPSPLLPSAVVVISALLRRRRRPESP